MVDVGKLQVFLAAAETENFSAAARRLGLSQPAISFRIQSLEAELNVKLFERVGKRVVLTETGHELLPLAYELINLATSIEDTMGVCRDTVTGQLHIGCGTSLTKHVLPHLIGAFSQHYPLVRINCEEMSHQAIADKLVKHEIHFGIIAQPSKRGKIYFDPLFTDELVLVVLASHPWAARGQVLPTELRQQNWILSDADLAANSLLSVGLKTHGIALEELRGGMRLGDTESVLTAVEAGQGVAFVSRLAAHQNLESGRIQVIQVEGMSPLRREIYLAYCKQGETRTQTFFRKFIQAAEGQSLIAKFALVPQED